MALELRTYSGDGDDLADLIVSSWQHVLKDTAWFPVWDRDFIRWKVMDPRVFDRDMIVAAYQDDRLIGCSVSLPCEFRIGDAAIKGSSCSFLSADPAYKRPGLAVRVIEEMRKRHIDGGYRISLGVRNVAPGALAKKFWDGYMKRHPDEGDILGRFKSWVHVFDGPAVARASLGTWEAMEARAGGVLPLGWTGARGCGQPCKPEEIARDLAIVAAGNPGVQIEQLHSEATLSHALHHEYCFAVRHPTAEALLAGYMIDWNGKSDVRVGFVDLVAGQAAPADMAALIVYAARQLRAKGAQMVVMMDQGAAPAEAFRRAAFVPVDPDVEYFVWYKDPTLAIPPGARCAVAFT
ncbi:MAG: hypothetical protein AAGF79_09930 [Pseudomonadota bacterium]